MSRQLLPVLNGFFTKERITADPAYNRWLVPPCALAIHICIGMAYGFSVYWLPMSTLIDNPPLALCQSETSVWQQLVSTRCNWRIPMLGWVYTLFFVFLGCSAALWGNWLEKTGPRMVGMVATLCWCGGLMLASAAVWLHQLWLLWLGAGVIGGIGLGLGYISPVSTLLRWFPDKKGMAAGLAIMGFGGGAMFGAPLAEDLMRFFSVDGRPGVWQSLLVLAGLYAVLMTAGTLSYRLPPVRQPPEPEPSGLITPASVQSITASDAVRCRQFWLLWLVLCLNVSAGIGLLGMASPLLQEVFSASRSLHSLTPLPEIAVLAAGFTGLLSLFNIAGRFFWASLSDRIGRKFTFSVFFAIGALGYSLLPSLAAANSVTLFLAICCLVISFYGGGFATIPAWLADLFGPKFVGAIHGRLLTAWSAAGVIGPMLVNYLREYQLESGKTGAAAWQLTLYILAGLLTVGLICNLLITPLLSPAPQRARSGEKVTTQPPGQPVAHSNWRQWISRHKVVLLCWAGISLPLLYGVVNTFHQTLLIISWGR